VVATPRRDYAVWSLFVYRMAVCHQLFQGWIATSLFFGDNFYVRRRKDLARLWLWKAVLITVPIHALYLAGIFWLDRAVPQMMTKAMVFLPVVGVGFAIESVAMQPLIDRFKPSEAN
jgi:hypothetical protein